MEEKRTCIKNGKFDFFRNRLAKREEQNRKRKLPSFIPLEKGRVNKQGRVLLNLSSNDYLGLTFNKTILRKAVLYAEKYGNGTGGSRLVTGSPDFYGEIEDKISLLKKKEKTILLNSGYQANISLLPAIAGRKSIIFSDYLNHNSIVRGALLSGGDFKRFRHNDLNHLEELLKKNLNKTYTSKIIVTESVFSMDGDFADIDEISDLSEKYGCIFIADEAHATGVFGENGMGIAHKADISIGTFGKGAGVFGASVSCSGLIYDYLVNFCEGLIFSTSFPPFTAGGISAALDLIPAMEKERKYLQKISNILRSGLENMGYDTGKGNTQIIPVIVGREDRAVFLSRFLEEKGILGIAIRPPSVPENMSRIRLSLSAVHSEEDIEKVLRAFYDWKSR